MIHADALTVLGVRFSDKSFFYVLCAVLAGSEGLRSAWPCATALLLGALYALPRSPLTLLRYPRAVRQLCRAFVLPLLQAPAEGAAAAAAVGGGGSSGGGGGGGTPRARAAPEASAPSEASVQQLVAMGFSAEDAAAALRASGGDIDAAVAELVAR